MAKQYDHNGRRIAGDYAQVNAQIHPCYLFQRGDGAIILECNHARRLDWLVPLMGLDQEPDFCRFESVLLKTETVRKLLANRPMKEPSQASQSHYWHLPRSLIKEAAENEKADA